MSKSTLTFILAAGMAALFILLGLHISNKFQRAKQIKSNKLESLRMLSPGHKQKVKMLMIVTSSNTFGDKQAEAPRETGVFFDEAALPLWAAAQSGIDVTVASPNGGAVPIDPISLEPKGLIKLYVATRDQTAFAIARLSHTAKLADCVDKQYDIVFFPGGHGASIDLPNNTDVEKVVRRAWESNKLVVAVCHGPDALQNVRLSNGRLLIAGKKMTMFSQAEEQHERLAQLMPKGTGEEGLKAKGVSYFKAPILFGVKTVQDGNLITGQNPMSVEATIEQVRRQADNMFN